MGNKDSGGEGGLLIIYFCSRRKMYGFSYDSYQLESFWCVASCHLGVDLQG